MVAVSTMPPAGTRSSGLWFQSAIPKRLTRSAMDPLSSGTSKGAWASAAVSELILSPSERGMLPVLDLDPTIEPAAAAGAFAVLGTQPLQPHLANVSEDHRSAAGQSGVVEADGALLGLPDQLQEPPLAL